MILVSSAIKEFVASEIETGPACRVGDSVLRSAFELFCSQKRLIAPRGGAFVKQLVARVEQACGVRPQTENIFADCSRKKRIRRWKEIRLKSQSSVVNGARELRVLPHPEKTDCVIVPKQLLDAWSRQVFTVAELTRSLSKEATAKTVGLALESLHFKIDRVGQTLLEASQDDIPF